MFSPLIVKHDSIWVIVAILDMELEHVDVKMT